ncbi:hypothetical protein M422DRAFT_247038 [Sphaerobolus stellatus SS14]|nr:hypothetical protein M422DRAFT_247038 [Sphaerobolus stellatus SS14]
MDQPQLRIYFCCNIYKEMILSTLAKDGLLESVISVPKPSPENKTGTGLYREGAIKRKIRAQALLRKWKPIMDAEDTPTVARLPDREAMKASKVDDKLSRNASACDQEAQPLIVKGGSTQLEPPTLKLPPEILLQFFKAGGNPCEYRVLEYSPCTDMDNSYRSPIKDLTTSDIAPLVISVPNLEALDLMLICLPDEATSNNLLLEALPRPTFSLREVSVYNVNLPVDHQWSWLLTNSKSIGFVKIRELLAELDQALVSVIGSLVHTLQIRSPYDDDGVTNLVSAMPALTSHKTLILGGLSDLWPWRYSTYDSLIEALEGSAEDHAKEVTDHATSSTGDNVGGGTTSGLSV